VSIPVRDLPDVLTLPGDAKLGDQEAFQSLTEPHRRELQVHRYGVLGSLHDAEDLVHETLLRAWRGLDRFEGRASFRSARSTGSATPTDRELCRCHQAPRNACQADRSRSLAA
jgi:hypothetical protein